MIKVDPKQIFEKADFNDYQDTTRYTMSRTYNGGLAAYTHRFGDNLCKSITNLINMKFALQTTLSANSQVW